MSSINTIYCEDQFKKNVTDLTFCMLKPDVLPRGLVGKIISEIEEDGFQILAMKQLQLDEEFVSIMYKDLVTKPFYSELSSYTISGPVIALVLRKENAPISFRNLIGATDPKDAESHTIRKKYGKSIECNSIHGSESAEYAIREISLFFSAREIFNMNSNKY